MKQHNKATSLSFELKAGAKDDEKVNGHRNNYRLSEDYAYAARSLKVKRPIKKVVKLVPRLCS